MSLKDKRVGYFFDEELSASLLKIEIYTSAWLGIINITARLFIVPSVLSILDDSSQCVYLCIRLQDVKALRLSAWSHDARYVLRTGGHSQAHAQPHGQKLHPLTPTC